VALFSRQKNLFGLDIGSSAVKAVELRQTGKGFEVIHAGMEPLASDTVVDGAIMDALSVADSINKVLTDQKIKTRTVATSVSGHSVIVKKVTLPQMSKEELDESIQWEAEQHIPFIRFWMPPVLLETRSCCWWRLRKTRFRTTRM
jgi:type IV pilus assembly protein PilM